MSVIAESNAKLNQITIDGRMGGAGRLPVWHEAGVAAGRTPAKNRGKASIYLFVIL